MTTQDPDLRAAIAALWERQRGEMMRRVDAVEAAVEALGESRLEEDQRAEGERAAHKIAGAAGTFGFHDATEHGRSLELALRAGPELDDAQRLSALVRELRAAFDRGPQDADDPGADEAPGLGDLDVLVVGGERIDETQLRAEFVARGLSTAVARADVELARRAHAPIVVIDLSEAGSDEVLEAVAGDGACVIGLAAAATLEARVGFTRRGGRLLLPADLLPSDVADAVVAMREQIASEGTRILVVDDDPVVLEVTTTTLRRNGLDVVSLDDPDRFWQTLEATNPDVVLLDLEMPGYNGLELCGAVRADPRWSQLPVLFLTARREPEAVRAVFAAGADDYMTKPVVEEELIQRIQNRLERIRLLRDRADHDPLTGLANRRKASEQLQRLERLARRYGQPLSLAIVDLDHFKHVNDSYGHDTGDDVLRRLGHRLASEFRGEDVVGRWGGEEFLIGMYGMPAGQAVQRLRDFLGDWKRERFEDGRKGAFATSFSAGIAELPSSSNKLTELQRLADDALYRAKAAGRSRVQLSGDRETGGAEQVDIALVEDDGALVDLLTQALSAEGWSVRAIDDGPTAVGALASEPPLLHARLVLLDWDLPGFDGVTVLRRLRERGVLSHTHVLMLTAREGEQEALEALELGAVDHVTKPFSVPVLIQKVRQITGRR